MRKLASIQKVAEVRAIEGADRIVAYRINDWWVVDGKDKYSVGDLVVYFEIDSLLPIAPQFEFLAPRGTSKSELEDGSIVEGYRLKTIRLKGQYSQGLIVPMGLVGIKTVEPERCSQGSSLIGRPYAYVKRGKVVTEMRIMDVCDDVTEIQMRIMDVGDDVTEILGVHKYEKPMNAQLRGTARGNFPSFLRKSDQERCQNLRKDIWTAYVAGDEFEVTVKLDGSSLTVFNVSNPLAESLQTEPRFGVCSRNLELKETEDNAFWKMANLLDLQSKLTNYMIQGELLAPNIQGNFEGVDRPRFFVYNAFSVSEHEYLPPKQTREWCSANGIDYVPVIEHHTTLQQLFPNATDDTIIPMLLEYADGPSGLNGKFREGLVFKRVDGQFSFKAISNKYLAKTGE